MKEIKEIRGIYDEIRSKELVGHSLNIRISKILALMSKTLKKVEEYLPSVGISRDSEFNREQILNRTKPIYSIKRDELLLLYSMYSNLQFYLFDKSGIWKEGTNAGRQRAIIKLSSNILQFCDFMETIVIDHTQDFSRLSELIFTLLELGLDDEADLARESLESYEKKGSEYEFCGSIRSCLEKIAVKLVTMLGEDDRNNIFYNLHTLTKKKIITKKLSKVIASNYSYGSQFIHHESKFDVKEAKFFIDQTLLHIESLLAKYEEIKNTDGSFTTEDTEE